MNKKYLDILNDLRWMEMETGLPIYEKFCRDYRRHIYFNPRKPKCKSFCDVYKKTEHNISFFIRYM